MATSSVETCLQEVIATCSFEWLYRKENSGYKYPFKLFLKQVMVTKSLQSSTGSSCKESNGHQLFLRTEGSDGHLFFQIPVEPY